MKMTYVLAAGNMCVLAVTKQSLLEHMQLKNIVRIGSSHDHRTGEAAHARPNK
jgi:hypothetical protein